MFQLPTRIEVLTKGSINLQKKGIILESPIRVYNIDDDFSEEELEEIKYLVADPVDDLVSEKPVLSSEGTMHLPDNTIFIEQSPKPGVTDPWGEETRKSIERVIGRKIGPVSFAHLHLFAGELDKRQFTLLSKQIGNPQINEFRRLNLKDLDPEVGMGFHFPDVDLPDVPAFEYIPIKDLNGKELEELSNKKMYFLNPEEMRTIIDLFENPEFIKARKEAGLEAVPTDADLENLGQTWSEHCIHKKLNAVWKYTSDDSNDESGIQSETNSLFKTIIKDTTQQIIDKFNIDWVVSVFKDNAGVIQLNETDNLGHKVETHNHPSSLDGFGGADTGTGGVIRDNKSTGINMIVISSQYAFRTPHPNAHPGLALDIQTPKRTLETVVAGVEDYGNKMGIPTMSGSVMIDDGWLKPAVYVGSVSMEKAELAGKKTHIKNVRTDYVALTLGGKVGKDGIHGATGSSTDLSADAEQIQEVNQSVQIGNPLTEKGVFEVMNILARLGYIEASQDCGAGGWNSAVGELAGLLNELEKKRYVIQQEFEQKGITINSSYQERLAAVPSLLGLDEKASPVADLLKQEIESGEIFSIQTNGKGGVVMDLSNVPEKYKGLTGWEKLISEAQEREVIVVKREYLEKVLEICEHNNVDAMKIAEFNNTGYYHVLDQNKTITFLPVEFMHQGLPQMEIKAHWTPCQNQEPEIAEQTDYTDTFLDLLSQPNMQSYDWIMTRYDHEVQGATLIKPLVGLGQAKSDAIAYRPLGKKEVIIESWGSNPWQGDIDTYHMGRNNVVDAVGKTIALGGSLERITFNGNTTCPKPEKDPEIAAKVIRMIKGAADAELVFGTPTISGKDSTSMQRSYIDMRTGEEVFVKAKPEYLMSSMAVIKDSSTLTTCDFKLPEDVIYVVGETRDELGASEFYLMNDETGRNVPKSDLDKLKSRYTAMENAIKSGIVHSAQYVSKGGLAAALANSSIGGDLGANIVLDNIDNELGRADKILFSETTGRFVVTVHKSKAKEFEERMQGHYFRKIGNVRGDSEFNILYKSEQIIGTDIYKIREKNKGDIRPGKLLEAA